MRLKTTQWHWEHNKACIVLCNLCYQHLNHTGTFCFHSQTTVSIFFPVLYYSKQFFNAVYVQSLWILYVFREVISLCSHWDANLTNRLFKCKPSQKEQVSANWDLKWRSGMHQKLKIFSLPSCSWAVFSEAALYHTAPSETARLVGWDTSEWVGDCGYYIGADCSADSVTSNGFIPPLPPSLFFCLPLSLFVSQEASACLCFCEISGQPSQVDGYQNPQTTPVFIVAERWQVMTYHYPAVIGFRSINSGFSCGLEIRCEGRFKMEKPECYQYWLLCDVVLVSAFLDKEMEYSEPSNDSSLKLLEETYLCFSVFISHLVFYPTSFFV